MDGNGFSVYEYGVLCGCAAKEEEIQGIGSDDILEYRQMMLYSVSYNMGGGGCFSFVENGGGDEEDDVEK